MTTPRHLVRHDYGMGALWWWIRADSAAKVLDVLADVEVVDDPEALGTAESWDLDEYDLAEAARGPLLDFARKRARQRLTPHFGQLLNRDRVYLRAPDTDDEPNVWYTEHDRTGRRLRQVEVRPDGTTLATTAADWPFNPPFDLGEYEYVQMEITRAEFLRVWKSATRR